MPRGKAKSVDEKLAELRQSIAVAEENLKQLKAEEKRLSKDKEEADLKKLYELLKQNGVSVDEAINKLNN